MEPQKYDNTPIAVQELAYHVYAQLQLCAPEYREMLISDLEGALIQKIGPIHAKFVLDNMNMTDNGASIPLPAYLTEE